jgi:hypothetical protein
MTSISQNVLFHMPRQLVVHRLELDDDGIATTLALVAELDPRPRALGVSLKLDKDAVVETVALACSTDVFLFSTRAAHRGQRRLARLFCGGAVLVAFEMAKLALLLQHTFGGPVAGVDLSTVFSKSSVDTESPATVVRNQLFQDDVVRIRAIWDGDRGDDVALRAFVCARSVASPLVPFPPD